jgi:beta-glucosidase/6-phospho-beta-glucosidase/beta-galactosidase
MFKAENSAVAIGATARTDHPELWGGAEYTCNRVGDCYFDQMQLSGHADRPEDLDLFAELGLSAMRCGALWEHHGRDGSWHRVDARLRAMQRAHIRPIVGLMHHGSGPAHTSLIDPEFPRKFAAYAGTVAARYPWIDTYTPVNEPNTTARFACLYGIWYPHHQSRKSYLRAILHQVRATVLSMRAIREVRSDAQLLQTEDLGCIWSTPELADTCDLLNERRWLPFDLLCGKVDHGHPLFSYMRDAGIGDDEILWFRDNPCPPTTVGVNYYLTSDRFLDHRREIYPSNSGSAEGPFVDVEAVRVRPEGIAGFDTLLIDAAERYRLPVAISEVHLGGEVDEQIRWAVEAWEGAMQARRMGANCVAITFWALLGSFFWNKLVTEDNGHYEPGVFDVSSGAPVSTALADVVSQLARGERPDHPALREQGWWRRPSRIHFAVPAELAA